MDYKVELLISRLLFDTIKIDTHYYTAPFKDISSVDRSLRTSLSDSDLLYKELQILFESIKPRALHFLTDKYLLNYIFFRPYENRPDLITLGPYTISPVNEAFYYTIIEANHLSFSQLNSLKDFMFCIPLLDDTSQLFSVIGDILSYLDEDIADFCYEKTDWYSESSNELDYVPQDELDAYIHMIEKRYQIEEEIFSAVSAGNQAVALNANKRFLDNMFSPRISDILQENKFMLNTVNTLCRKAAQKSHVHPIFLHEISSTHIKAIDKITDVETAQKYCNHIISKYCHLIVNKTREGYSPLIGQLMNYIELNINQPLRLTHLAERFHISAPYLSSLFKKEVGVTITEYILEYRLHTALKLINSTSMEVQDVAYHVGISDANYFTKLFKKYYNYTPTAYRKHLKMI